MINITKLIAVITLIFGLNACQTTQSSNNKSKAHEGKDFYGRPLNRNR
jgi:hypothetical protein